MGNKREFGKGRKGFTLVEIAVSIAVILVVMAMAIPNLLKMYMVGNEASVVQAVRSVVISLESYRTRESQGNLKGPYPRTLQELVVVPPGMPPYLDSRFSGMARPFGEWKGYRFFYRSFTTGRSVGNINYLVGTGFVLQADPIRRGISGQRSFFVDQTGVVRFNTQAPAGAGDTPVGEDR
jgi:prepilin-type N-terminal cleavage/methylation domain-containing protein